MNKSIGKITKKNLAWIREGDCIRCTSHALDNRGYPRMRRGGNPIRIARWILIRRHGYIPTGMVSRHTCDNTWCIRPDHIIIGTQSDNIRDRVERCRSADQRGENGSNSKLTSLQVLEIREATGVAREIATKFGTSIGNVYQIRHGTRWKHI
jgi:hypothetical protein